MICFPPTITATVIVVTAAGLTVIELALLTNESVRYPLELVPAAVPALFTDTPSVSAVVSLTDIDSELLPVVNEAGERDVVAETP